MSIHSFFSLLGGLALFLYGMQMMSTNLEAAAGSRMKQILVLIENELEQSITGDILRSGLGAEAEITLTAGAEQAIQQLRGDPV